MQNQRNLTEIIQSLCKSALAGELKLEQFYDSWPEAASAHPFLKQIYEDVEDAVEHLPGAWRSGRMLVDEWRRSSMYLTIYLDSVLLQYEKKADELLQCREFIRKQKDLSEDKIKLQVAEYLRRF
jgi:hypothetical protein